MAHIEKPRLNKTTNDYSIRVIFYRGGKKQRPLTLKGYPDAGSAIEAATHEAHRLDRERYLASVIESPDPLQVGLEMYGCELVDHWYEFYVVPSCRGSTPENYERDAARYFTPFWGNKIIGRQGKAQGREYTKWLLAEIRKNMRARGAMPDNPDDAEYAGVPEANRVITMASSIWTYGVDNGWLREENHPLGKSKMTGKLRFDYIGNRVRDDYVPYPEEIEAYRACIAWGKPDWVRLRDQAIIELVAYGLFRQQDLLEATLDLLFDEEGRPRTIVDLRRRRGTELARKSPSAERLPLIPESTRETLAAYLEARGRPPLSEVAFPGEKRLRVMSRQNWQRDSWRPVRAFVSKLDVEVVEVRERDPETGAITSVERPRWYANGVLGIHMTRRCGTTMMAYAGEPIQSILAQIGHNQRADRTLIQYYMRAVAQREAGHRRLVPVEEQIRRAREKYSSPEAQARIAELYEQQLAEDQSAGKPKSRRRRSL